MFFTPIWQEDRTFLNIFDWKNLIFGYDISAGVVEFEEFLFCGELI